MPVLSYRVIKSPLVVFCPAERVTYVGQKLCYVVFPQGDPSETEPLTASKNTDWALRFAPDLPANNTCFSLFVITEWTAKRRFRPAAQTRPRLGALARLAAHSLLRAAFLFFRTDFLLCHHHFHSLLLFLDFNLNLELMCLVKCVYVCTVCSILVCAGILDCVITFYEVNMQTVFCT